MKNLATVSIAALLAFMVAATAGVGLTVAQSSEESATSAAPSNLTATYTEGRLTLRWTKGTDLTYTEQVVEWRESGVTPIRWSTGGMPTGWEILDFPLSVLDAGTTYVFRMGGAKLKDGFIQGVAYSNEVTVTIPAAEAAEEEASPQPESQTKPTATATTAPEAPAPAAAPPPPPAQRRPSALSATVADGAVTLSWAPGTHPGIVKQVVKRREPRGRWTDVEVGVSANSYTDTTVQSGKRYIYRIQGQKSNGRGPISNVARINVP